MAKKRTSYIAAITKALKNNGKYNEGLKLGIESVADTLVVRDLCRNDIDQLQITTVKETTRYGEKIAPHPVFKILRDAQATLDKGCKSLGLTYAELMKELDLDPLKEFVDSINNKNIISNEKD